MGVKNILLTINSELFEKMKNKSKKLCYDNVQQYIYYLIRRDLFYKKAGVKSTDEAYLDKFSAPTRKTKKLIRMAKRQGGLT